MMFFCESTLNGKPRLDRWGGMAKIPQWRALSWLFEGGDREDGDGVDRHGAACYLLAVCYLLLCMGSS